MNTSIHLRFALYVLCVTGCLTAVILSWDHNEFFIVFYMLLFWARKFLGLKYNGWHESDREINNRTLVIGFFICLVIVWVGGITVARYFAPERHAPKYLLWIIVAVLWFLMIYPAYQFWRSQSISSSKASAH